MNSINNMSKNSILLPPQCIRTNPRFSHAKVIGEGVFGTVWKAKDSNNTAESKQMSGQQQWVAIKYIKMDPTYDRTSQGLIPCILREVCIMRRLCHRNVLPLLDLIVHDTSLDALLIMPLQEMNLSEWMCKYQGTYKLCHIQQIMSEILAGCQHLHENQVLHRDIKPNNILMSFCSSCISRESSSQSTSQRAAIYVGTIKIADFGLSRLSRSKTNTCFSFPIQAEYYRAPEVLLGCKRYTASVDVWSVGCVMAELLRDGHVFFQSNDSPSVSVNGNNDDDDDSDDDTTSPYPPFSLPTTTNSSLYSNDNNNNNSNNNNFVVAAAPAPAAAYSKEGDSISASEKFLSRCPTWSLSTAESIVPPPQPMAKKQQQQQQHNDIRSDKKAKGSTSSVLLRLKRIFEILGCPTEARSTAEAATATDALATMTPKSRGAAAATAAAATATITSPVNGAAINNIALKDYDRSRVAGEVNGEELLPLLPSQLVVKPAAAASQKKQQQQTVCGTPSLGNCLHRAALIRQSIQECEMSRHLKNRFFTTGGDEQMQNQHHTQLVTHLLWRMLKLSPSRRVGFAQAMHHPFFGLKLLK